MRIQTLLITACATAALLVACSRNCDCDQKPPDATQGKTATPEPAPEPTLVCKSATTKRRPSAFTGEKLDATDEVVDATLQKEREAAEAARAQWAGRTFDEFLASVVRECGEEGKYIVNGDVAFSDIKHLREFFEQIQSQAPPPPLVEAQVDGNKFKVSSFVVNPLAGAAELATNTVAGQETLWSSAQKKQISYCVSNFFNSKHAQVVADIAAAAGAWERVADVKFVYVPAQDASCTAANNAVVFDVRPVDVGGDYLARAFFPNEPRSVRNVLIDLSALDLPTTPSPNDELTLKGVLRHELGHTLGFRHEHTRPQSGACFEDSNFNPITTYDKFSVMHYPQCNGGTSWQLLLTPRDESGAACVYGATAGFNIDTGLCVPRVIVPIPPDAPISVKHLNQSVAKGAEKSYPALTAKPGSIITFRMTPSGTKPGDPDLYVRFGAQGPRVSPPRYNCRPYRTGATESCDLTVPPAPNNVARYLVHGYTAGSYNLEVTYVRATP